MDVPVMIQSIFGRVQSQCELEHKHGVLTSTAQSVLLNY